MTTFTHSRRLSSTVSFMAWFTSSCAHGKYLQTLSVDLLVTEVMHTRARSSNRVIVQVIRFKFVCFDACPVRKVPFPLFFGRDTAAESNPVLEWSVLCHESSQSELMGLPTRTVVDVIPTIFIVSESWHREQVGKTPGPNICCMEMTSWWRWCQMPCW